MYTDYTLTSRVDNLEKLFKYIYCKIKNNPSGEEVDPIFTSSPAHSITQTDINKWNSEAFRIQTKEFFDTFTGTTLTLTNTPKVGTIVNVIENGITLREGITRDYTISGKIVTLLTNRTNVDIEINYTY